MARTYNADEIFRMAEQIERNGRLFYVRAAENAENPELADLLQRLADMEADHEALFVDMRKQIATEGVPQIEYDPDRDVVRYLQAAADTKIFDIREDPTDKLSGNESPQKLLRLAIGLEKESVVFYAGIRGLVPEQLGASKIEWLIDQELSHVADLTEQLRSLQAQRAE